MKTAFKLVSVWELGFAIAALVWDVWLAEGKHNPAAFDSLSPPRQTRWWRFQVQDPALKVSELVVAVAEAGVSCLKLVSPWGLGGSFSHGFLIRGCSYFDVSWIPLSLWQYLAPHLPDGGIVGNSSEGSVPDCSGSLFLGPHPELIPPALSTIW